MALRNPTCGCDACETPLSCDACCRCIPRNICVLVAAPGEPAGTDADVIHLHNCLREIRVEIPWDKASQSYYDPDVMPHVSCPALDLRFTIEHRGDFQGTDDECFLCLESAALGYFPPSDSGTGTPDTRQCEQPFGCRDPNATFNGTVEFNGLEQEVTITVFKPAVTENPNGTRCNGCVGCKCVPSKLCLYFDSDDDGCFIYAEAELDENGQYIIEQECSNAIRTPLKFILSIGKLPHDADEGGTGDPGTGTQEPDDRCYLKLVVPGATIINEDGTGAGEAYLLLDDCPNLEASWFIRLDRNFGTGSCEFPEELATVEGRLRIKAFKCGQCDFPPNDCCPKVPQIQYFGIPSGILTNLTFTIDNHDCVNDRGLLAGTQVPLTFYPICQPWRITDLYPDSELGIAFGGMWVGTLLISAEENFYLWCCSQAACGDAPLWTDVLFIFQFFCFTATDGYDLNVVTYIPGNGVTISESSDLSSNSGEHTATDCDPFLVRFPIINGISGVELHPIPICTENPSDCGGVTTKNFAVIGGEVTE